jgi:hypothetical protein
MPADALVWVEKGRTKTEPIPMISSLAQPVASGIGIRGQQDDGRQGSRSDKEHREPTHVFSPQESPSVSFGHSTQHVVTARLLADGFVDVPRTKAALASDCLKVVLACQQYRSGGQDRATDQALKTTYIERCRSADNLTACQPKARLLHGVILVETRIRDYIKCGIYGARTA